MRSNLDIWAIQKNKEEIDVALENVEKEAIGNILYLNCRCWFKIGDQKVENRTFDAMFYSEESDVVILFAKGLVSEKDIVEGLEKKGVKYTTIRFIEQEKEYKDDEEIPDIWFAREKYVLIDAIKDSINKGIKKCQYYSNLESVLSLYYKDNNGDRNEIDGKFFKGCLVFEDKIVLLVNQGYFRNLKEEDVKKILKDYKITYSKNIKR